MEDATYEFGRDQAVATNGQPSAWRATGGLRVAKLPGLSLASGSQTWEVDWGIPLASAVFGTRLQRTSRTIRCIDSFDRNGHPDRASDSGAIEGGGSHSDQQSYGLLPVAATAGRGELIARICTDMLMPCAVSGTAREPDMLIDSHHHLWKYSDQQYAWISADMELLRRDFLAAELRQVAAASGVDGFVTVQARQSLIENDDLLAIAKDEPLIRGIVGWVPLADRHVGQLLDRYAANPLFKGVRHVIQDEPDDRFILDADFNRGITQLADRNLIYDVLIFAKHLSAAIEFVDRHPHQLMVVDHIAKPTIWAAQYDQVWERKFRELAKRDNVRCKFSGVITEVRDQTWSIDTIRRYWEVAVESYAPGRLMFGSDWPVCLLRASHQKWTETVRRLAGELSSDEQADLFANTAIKAYNLAV